VAHYMPSKTKHNKTTSVLRGQNSSFPQQAVSPNTLRYTREITEQLPIMNTRAAALRKLGSGTALCPRTALAKAPGLQHPAPLAAALPGQPGARAARLRRCHHHDRCGAEQHGAAVGEYRCSCRDPKFLFSILMLSTTVTPMLTSQTLYLACWLHQPQFSFALLYTLPFSPTPVEGTFSGYSLPTFTPPSTPPCIATLTKPPPTAKAGALYWKDALGWYVLATGSRPDTAFLPIAGKGAIWVVQARSLPASSTRQLPFVLPEPPPLPQLLRLLRDVSDHPVF